MEDLLEKEDEFITTCSQGTLENGRDRSMDWREAVGHRFQFVDNKSKTQRAFFFHKKVYSSKIGRVAPQSLGSSCLPALSSSNSPCVPKWLLEFHSFHPNSRKREGGRTKGQKVIVLLPF